MVIRQYRNERPRRHLPSNLGPQYGSDGYPIHAADDVAPVDVKAVEGAGGEAGDVCNFDFPRLFLEAKTVDDIVWTGSSSRNVVVHLPGEDVRVSTWTFTL